MKLQGKLNTSLKCSQTIEFLKCSKTLDAQGSFQFFSLEVTFIALVLVMIFRGWGYPKYYNKAVRYYYKGDVKKAVKYARKSAARKNNFARVWIDEIIKTERHDINS